MLIFTYSFYVYKAWYINIMIWKVYLTVRYISDLLHWFSDDHLSWGKVSSEWIEEIKNLTYLPLI